MADDQLMMKTAVVLSVMLAIGIFIAFVMAPGPWVMWLVLPLLITGGVAGWKFGAVQEREHPARTDVCERPPLGRDEK